jgi:hypothetical protein
VDLATRFAKALDSESDAGPADCDLLPERLARAAAAVLPVDGVGLSIHGGPDTRTPLAASCEAAATVERLQFTVGRGPCLLAASSGLPIFANQALLARRWPVFHDLLVCKTTIRSLLALSLPGRLRGIGAMDLYFRSADGPTAIDVLEARSVAGLVSEHLGPAADWSPWTPGEDPDWPNTPAARRRGKLWMAVGMVMLAAHLPTADALALLRAHAYATDQTVDDLAADLAERRLHPDELLADRER